jgi:hypothetical protein
MAAGHPRKKPARTLERRPRLDEGAAYIFGWLAGYITADGTVPSNGRVLLNSVRRENLEFAAAVANVLCIASYPNISRPAARPCVGGRYGSFTIGGRSLRQVR